MRASWHAGAVQERMQRGDVAVAHQEFGLALDQCNIDVSQQAHGAVATAQADHGRDLVVSKRGVQVGQALAVGAGQVAMGRVGHAATRVQPHAQAVAREERFDQGQAFGRRRPGGGDDADEVARTQRLKWLHVKRLRATAPGPRRWQRPMLAAATLWPGRGGAHSGHPDC